MLKKENLTANLYQRRKCRGRSMPATIGHRRAAIIRASQQTPGPLKLRVNYQRRDKNHNLGWRLHVWGDVTQQTQWPVGLAPVGSDERQCWWEVDVPPGASRVGLLVHRGENKSCEGVLEVSRVLQGAAATTRAQQEQQPRDGAATAQVWLAGDAPGVLVSPPDLSVLPAGNLSKCCGHWIDRRTLLWRCPAADASGPRTFALHSSRQAGLWVDGRGIQGSDRTLELVVLESAVRCPGGIPPEALARFPYLAGCTPLTLAPGVELSDDDYQQLVSSQLALSASASDGTPLDGTGLQLQGLLDDLYGWYDGPLGYSHNGGGSSSSSSSSSGGGGGGAALRVWAPTAQRVEVLHWDGPRDGPPPRVHAMTRLSSDATGGRPSGVWELVLPGGSGGGGGWLGSYYKYRVTAYHHWTKRVEVMEAADPYSRSSSANGERSHIVGDLTQPAVADALGTAPAGWWDHARPGLPASPTDISLYELHVRDFSACDDTVPPQLRGKYLAFSPQHVRQAQQAAGLGAAGPDDLLVSGDRVQQQQQQQQQPSAGLAHLAALQAAGLTHVHLLPVYDFGSVPERPEERRELDVQGLRGRRLPPDSPEQQAALAAVCDVDSYNWGYDPVLYGVPEGSYATQPDGGGSRLAEFRSMVQGLHSLGLSVVLDVVYNHTYDAGPHGRHSVLDKIVPGYYHRRDEDGQLCNSTCCNNTATENAMCERLVVDDVLHWATSYKVDGFRFDIMAHMLLRTMRRIRAALDGLTLEAHGVDGRRIYLYGEAWSFGEMEHNQRGRNAAQANIGGSGLGAFNDRLRDGALGGGPFSPPDFQGLATGLATDPNSNEEQGSSAEQRSTLLRLTDMVRYSLAGLLAQYELHCSDGQRRAGGQFMVHGGMPCAYGSEPCEHIAFIGCHDNVTLFDQVTEKAALSGAAAGGDAAAAAAGVEQRGRMALLCLGLIALSQGVPFFHAGDDLLRSKSLDRDSYNSGDWFNGLDWSGRSHNLGVGLPPATKNGSFWRFKGALLARAAALRPDRRIIAHTAAGFRLLLRLRYSSPLFRLPTAAAICRQLHFHNTGPDQLLGVVVMELVSADQLAPGDRDGGVVDDTFSRLVVVFNACPWPQALPYPQHAERLTLHPLQAAEASAAVGGGSGGGGGDADYLSRCGASDEERRLMVAPRTTAVFVTPR